MSKYEMEVANRDKAALAAAKDCISRLVAGEGDMACSIYLDDYLRISGYFNENNKPTGASKRVYRMFHAIATKVTIGGFDARSYTALIDEIERKLKSMRKFYRRPKLKCFTPREHRQPCYCARLAAVLAHRAVAENETLPPSAKEELASKINGQMALEKEFQDESQRA